MPSTLTTIEMNPHSKYQEEEADEARETLMPMALGLLKPEQPA
jgi:hypothetical protein